ncbi:hypothetical protein [Sporosarcina limicola]|uniref:Uncharacterized protein n=1 Tax=Sporosarcina limicola TaxID=34101 RepID=A0A927MEK9_9BACL|nr:hypothetical protein [Sporosarcina limicola]MBE1553208.1 hypothetical protein [Sporosarcina limicola]
MLKGEWKYENLERGDYTYFEDWMRFSFILANYVKEIDKPLKLYISVPSNLLFSYFFILGALDHDFKNPSRDALLQQYLTLQKGQRVLYKTSKGWVAHSVIEVSKMPGSETRAIVVKDRLNAINYIPETRWFDYLRIHDDGITTVRNTRLVRSVDSITENIKLKNLYTEEKLQLLMMQNTPQTYLFANKKEWIGSLSSIQLEAEGEVFQLNDLVFDGTEGTFKNISFIEQSFSIPIPNEAIAVFIGSGHSLRKMDYFDGGKSVFIVDQHDSEDKFEDLQFKIEQDFLLGQSRSVNKEILDYMDDNQVEIPKGVEIFAWLSQS